MAFIEGVTNRWLKKKSPFRNKVRMVTAETNEQTVPSVEPDAPICPPRELTEVLIQTARNLQMLPDVAVQAIKVAESPDSRISELVAIISQDIKLTTNILSLSNSVLFGAGQTISSLQIAITRLGFRQTKNMIMASCFSNMLQSMQWEEARTRDLLCQHSFLTGIICSRLNKLFRLGMQGEEFTAGLMHDVGRTLLAVAIPNKFRDLDPIDFNEDEQLEERELASIGTTHAEIGAWFLQRNHLPDELVSVARYHHTPQKSSMFLRLVSLVSIADELANCHGRREAEDIDLSKLTGAQLLETLGVQEATNILSGSWKEVLETSVAESNQLMCF